MPKITVLSYRMLIIAFVSLFLIGCSHHPSDAKKVPSKYRPTLNPHPKYFMIVKGFIDPRLQHHIHLTIIAEYATYNKDPKCNVWVNYFEGVQEPWKISHTYNIHTNSQGNYVLSVPLDPYFPMKCNWHISNISYAIHSQKKFSSEMLAFFYKDSQSNLSSSYGETTLNCTKHSCVVVDLKGLAQTGKTLSFYQQYRFTLNLIYRDHKNDNNP